MTFRDVVMEVWDNPDFMQEYRRLTGELKLPPPRSPIEAMVDQAAGYKPQLDQAELRRFFRFVWKYVWLPVVSKEAEER
jgi:hypothetical protein